MTPKTVMFEMDAGDSPKLDMATGGAGDNVTRKCDKCLRNQLSLVV